LALELRLIEVRIQPVSFEQLVVGAALDDATVGDHQDQVGVTHGGETVRDYQ
jgi:hypothetical protein